MRFNTLSTRECRNCANLEKHIAEMKKLEEQFAKTGKEVDELKLALQTETIKVKDLEDKLAKAETRYGETQSELNLVKQEIVRLKQQILELRTERDQQPRVIDTLTANTQDLAAQFTEFRQEHASLQNLVARQQAVLTHLQGLVNVDHIIAGQIPFQVFAYLSRQLFEDVATQRQCAKAVTYTDFVQLAQQSAWWSERWASLFVEIGTEEEINACIADLKQKRRKNVHPDLSRIPYGGILVSIHKTLPRRSGHRDVATGLLDLLKTLETVS